MKKTAVSIVAVALLICCLFQGCADEGNGLAVAAKPVQEEIKNPAEPPVAPNDGLLNKMAGLLEQAKSSTPSVDDMKKILSDTGEAAGGTADDTMNWAHDTFVMLKGKGETASDNALDWLKDDWNAMNSWEYSVVSISAEDLASDPSLLESKLNESGKLRWECFHVSDNSTGMKFFMKRQKKSYLKNIPLKDLMKLVPLLDGE